jgi:hypothetical protein
MHHELIGYLLGALGREDLTPKELASRQASAAGSNASDGIRRLTPAGSPVTLRQGPEQREGTLAWRSISPCNPTLADSWRFCGVD